MEPPGSQSWVVTTTPPLLISQLPLFCSQNYRYSGIQFRNGTFVCACGQSHGRYGPSTMCDQNCPGDPLNRCGGSNFSNVIMCKWLLWICPRGGMMIELYPSIPINYLVIVHIFLCAWEYDITGPGKSTKVVKEGRLEAGEFFLGCFSHNTV